MTLNRATAEHYEDVLALMDRSFSRDETAPLRNDFPTALSRSNLNRLFVGRVDDTMVCAASALVRDWITGWGTLRTACLGRFATEPRERGQGLSRHLQEWMLKELRLEGVDWALLWTDRPAIFQGRGFEAVGEEFHVELASGAWPSPENGQRVRSGTPQDAAALLTLYETHAWRAQRSLTDMESHLHELVSRSLILEDETGAVAYAAVGKGLDLAGYVHEHAGPRRAVQALWGEAGTQLGADHILAPQGAEGYLEGSEQQLQGWGSRLPWLAG